MTTATSLGWNEQVTDGVKLRMGEYNGTDHISRYKVRPESQTESHSVMSDSLQPQTVHGILQATILECVAFPFRGSFQPRDQTLVSRIAGGHLSHQGGLTIATTHTNGKYERQRVLPCR